LRANSADKGIPRAELLAIRRAIRVRLCVCTSSAQLRIADFALRVFTPICAAVDILRVPITRRRLTGDAVRSVAPSSRAFARRGSLNVDVIARTTDPQLFNVFPAVFGAAVIVAHRAAHDKHGQERENSDRQSPVDQLKISLDAKGDFKLKNSASKNNHLLAKIIASFF